MNMQFINILAWIFGIGSFLLLALRIHAAASYTVLEASLDRLNGVRATFPIGKPLFVFVICVAWIISN